MPGAGDPKVWGNFTLCCQQSFGRNASAKVRGNGVNDTSCYLVRSAPKALCDAARAATVATHHSPTSPLTVFPQAPGVSQGPCFYVDILANNNCSSTNSTTQCIVCEQLIGAC
jgi:hypothetical protein